EALADDVAIRTIGTTANVPDSWTLFTGRFTAGSSPTTTIVLAGAAGWIHYSDGRVFVTDVNITDLGCSPPALFIPVQLMVGIPPVNWTEIHSCAISDSGVAYSIEYEFQCQQALI